MHMDQIERESNNIYRLSNKAAAFGESVLESVLQEKEILNATIQSLKDLLSRVDDSRANAQVKPPATVSQMSASGCWPQLMCHMAASGRNIFANVLCSALTQGSKQQ